MNHNDFKKLLQLSFYGELNSSEYQELKEHLEKCEECRTELEQQKNILALLSNTEKENIDKSLLMEARAQLRGALRNERQHRSYFQLLLTYLSEFISVPSRLALSGVTLVVLGFFIGFLVFRNSSVSPITQQNNNDNEFSLIQDNVSINNVRFIDSDPTDGEVEFTFNAVKPITLKGKVSDPKIQSILTYAMLNEQNPGARLNSINAIDYGKSKYFDNDVKNVLITVLLTDQNSGVRREALKLMKKFPYDEDVKQAYLYVLANDSSSGLKIEAINALLENIQSGNTLNKNDINLFKEKLQKDDNSYIRYRTKTILEEYN